MPNNRELALIVFAVAGLVWCLTQPEMRSHIRGMWKTAFPTLVAYALGFAAWTVAIVWIGSQVGWWNKSLTASTVLWFLTAGIVFLGALTDVGKEPHWFRRKAGTAFGVAVILEGITSVYVFPLVIEVFLFVALLVLGALSAFASTDLRYHQVKQLADRCIAILVIAMVFRSVVGILSDVGSDQASGSLRQALLAVWLTAAAVPYVYAVALGSAYSSTWGDIDKHCRTNGLARRASWRAKALTIGAFTTRVRPLSRFKGVWPSRLAEAGSVEDGRRVLDDFRAAEAERLRRQRETAEREAAYQARLQRFAGVDGTDDEGRQLDRREFRETQAALRWLANCQSGWHQRQGGVYRERVLGFLNAASYGLPEDHGVRMEIADKGQAWFAWRRTAGGWVFAIGSSGPPPNEWVYDGPEPPTGFPASGAQWGTAPFTDDVSPNWQD